MSLYTAVPLGSSTANSTWNRFIIFTITFLPKPVGLRVFSKKRHPSSLSKKVCSPLGPLCEGDSPQRGEMSRSDRGAWARRAPPAGGGGENCTAARNISGYGKVLSLRPFGAPPSQRCVQIHGQPFYENQHLHLLLADFSAPIFHFQKNVNLRKIHEVDYAEKDCNNCCSLFG